MIAVDLLLVTALVALIGGVFVHAYVTKDKAWFFSPLTLFSAVYAYYFVVGPLITLGMGETSFYGTNLRDSMWKPWLAGLLSLSGIFVGFLCYTPRLNFKYLRGFDTRLRKKTWTAFYILFGLGLLGFAYDAYFSGQPLLNLLIPFHSSVQAESTEREGIAVGNYLFLLINAFIPAMCLLYLLLRETARWKRWVIMGLLLAQICLFYSSLGFRHRIVTIVISVVTVRFLVKKLRPMLWQIALGGSGIILMAGTIVLTRSYGRGLDFSLLSDLSFFDLFLGGFNDAGTFYTTALVINSFPSSIPYVGLDPFWIALTIPIPRSFWPNKPYPAFLDHFEFLMGTRGQAVPVVGEHYMMAGWIGVVIGGFTLGLIYKFFWTFYRKNPTNPVVIALYAVAFALIFPLVNRGYLAQTLMEFFFDLFPLLVFYVSVRKWMLPALGSERLHRRAHA